MDTVSHSCFSYLVCRATGAASTPRIGLVAATVAVLPDLDFLLIPVLPDLASFAFHRGPSHSLFMAVLMGFLLGGLISRWVNLSWLRAGLLVGLAWFSHLVLDMCTGFGVALLWPYSHARSSFDLLFVVDLLASLPLIIATLCDLLYNWNRTVRRKTIAISGIVMWGVYAASALTIRSAITDDFLSELQKQGYEVGEIHAEPTPFNNQLWYLCAKTERGFVITYRSIWDGEQWEQWTELPRHQTALTTFADGHDLPDKMNVVLEDWYTCLSTDEGGLDVIDLRLGKRYGWEDDDAPFLFIYQLWHAESGALRWSMNKPGSRYDFGRLKALFTRVVGEIPDHRVQSVLPVDRVAPKIEIHHSLGQ